MSVPTVPEPPDLVFEFERSKIAARAARDEVARLLSARTPASDTARDEVLLVVTELVANVVRHGGAPGVVRVWARGGGLVRVEVFDCDPLGVPTVRPTSPAAATSRGLRIVDRLAHAWGVDVTPRGKTVWAEILESAEQP